MKFSKPFVTLIAVGLGGCVHTNTQPLAPNVVRIETEAGGTLYRGQAAGATMVAAARATLAAGYTHFKMSDISGGQGESVMAVRQVGNSKIANIYAPNGGADVSNATVTMFRADEPGAQGAFDARAVLAQYGAQAG